MKNLTSNENVWCTPEQVAQELVISRNLVYKFIRNQKLPATKVGDKIWRIRRADLSKFLKTSFME
jgi:excisionase family DNA binding protein